MLTEKDYCDYETSITLGELGFPLKRMKVKNFIDGKFSDSIVTVLLYEAQKWLREEKGIIISPAPYEDFKWCACIYRIKFPDKLNKEFDSYEEALLEGIKEAVKILKEK